MGGSAPVGTSPADLADYAYCPRSHWYRHHPPAVGPSAGSQRRSAEGERFHARTLHRTRVRAEHGAAYVALVVLGLLLMVGGILWLLR